MSNSLSNEYSTVHENIALHTLPDCPPLIQMRELIPRYHCVSVFTAVLPGSDNNAGSVQEHMGHLSKNSQSRAKSRNNHFHSEGERGRELEKGSGVGKSILFVYCIWLNRYVRSTEKMFPRKYFLARGWTVGRYNIVSCIPSALQRVCSLKLGERLAKIRLWSHCVWKLHIRPHSNLST